MKIKTEDVLGMKAFIKIGCYIIASLEMMVSAVLVIYPIYLIVDHVSWVMVWGYPVSHVHIGVCVFFIFIGILCSAFTSAMVYGLRTFNLRYINIYILFRFVFLGLFLLTAVILILYVAFLLKRGVVGMILLIVNAFLITGFLKVFSLSFAILQYNIMLTN